MEKVEKSLDNKKLRVVTVVRDNERWEMMGPQSTSCTDDVELQVSSGVAPRDGVSRW